MAEVLGAEQFAPDRVSDIHVGKESNPGALSGLPELGLEVFTFFGLFEKCEMAHEQAARL